jgi:hypothetical protein
MWGSPEGKVPGRAKEALVRGRGKLRVELLTRAFDKNLELAFRGRTGLVERLAATARALEPLGVAEDLVIEASLPGAFCGCVRLPSEPNALLFVRYGTLALAAEKLNIRVSLADPQAAWRGFGLAAPLANPASYWSSGDGLLPKPLLAGVTRALELLSGEEGVSLPPPLPEDTGFAASPARAGDLVLVPVGTRSGLRLLVLGPGGGVLVPAGSSLEGKDERKRRAWEALRKAFVEAKKEGKAEASEKALAALLEGEGTRGERVLEALRDPRRFALLGLARA